MGGNGIQNTEKITQWHIRSGTALVAIASAMAAVQIATQCALPKELTQWVLTKKLPLFDAPQFESQSLSYG